MPWMGTVVPNEIILPIFDGNLLDGEAMVGNGHRDLED
jgi:hypothetical protein